VLIKSNFLFNHKKIIIIGIITIIFISVAGVTFFKSKNRVAFAKEAEQNVIEEYAEVTKGNVTNSITSSGAIESSNYKNVASEVSAKVQNVYVKVGDKVNKGDVLFKLDSSSLDTQIRNKEKSLSSYQKQITNYEKNIKNYEEDIEDYKEDISNLNVYSDVSGYVKNVKVVKGDSVNKNAIIFGVVSNKNYILEVDISYFEKSPIQVGDTVNMLAVDSFSPLTGTVKEVSDLKTQSSLGGQLQKIKVELESVDYTLENVEVGQIRVLTQSGVTIYAEDNATIKVQDPENFRVNTSGTVKEVLVKDGTYINVGDLVLVLENEDLDKKITDASDSIENVKSNIQDNKVSINDVTKEIADLKDDYSFYTITSPIDGVITSVAISEGDYVRAESTIAKIVNTDVLQFEISVDELDILKLDLGQEAKITIDAIEETTLNPIIGYVSEIGLEGTNMNSVTSYPVTITFEGREDIKMGMNCSVEIVVEDAEDVMALPVEALYSRRNKYFVVLEDGETKEVEIGIYNDSFVEIKSGLSLGDKVKLPTKVVATTAAKTEEQAGGFSMMGGGMPGGGMPTGGSFPGGGMQGGGNMGGSRPSSSSQGGSRTGGSSRGGF